MSVRMLQAIAMIATLAVILWSLGLPSLHFAQAVNLTTVSDVMSDSAPAASSTHTFTFSVPSGVAGGEYATITMPVGFANIAALTAGDIAMTITGDGVQTIGAACGAVDVAFTTSGQNLIFELCSAAATSIGAGGTTTITVGTIPGNAIVNPTPAGDSQSYEVTFAAGADTGATQIVVISTVLVTATVDTIFTFKVSGLPAGFEIDGYSTTTGLSSTTSIPFGKLEADTASTAAQRLTVSTNASNGYVVTVQADGAFQSATGAVIDDFIDGSATNTPTAWVSPAGTVGSLNTYGHWGIISDDNVTTRDAGDEFAAGEYVTASTSPIVVMSNDGPANGANPVGQKGVGTTTVGYKVEITSLQEAADDYSAVLTYIATPTF